jgi:hypothetical protein
LQNNKLSASDSPLRLDVENVIASLFSKLQEKSDSLKRPNVLAGKLFRRFLRMREWDYSKK